MNPALFLDRDGIINIDRNYVHKPEDFVFVEGIFDLCRTAQSYGRRIHIVTNQAGIARGYYTERDFLNLCDWMQTQFIVQGIMIEAVHYCPFHEEYGIGEYKKPSHRRKPAPGMILDAAESWGLDLSRSAMVGDQFTDMQAAQSAGVRDKILVPRNDAEKMKAGNAEWRVIFASTVVEAAYKLHDMLIEDSSAR